MRIKRKHIIILFVLALLITNFSFAQDTSLYKVQRLPFNSWSYSAYAPMILEDGLVFCSNRKLFKNFPKDYKTKTGYRPFNLLFTSQKDSLKWNTPKIFSKDLFSKVNEGPSTFCEFTKTLFYTRNLLTENTFSIENNTLGIFYTTWSPSVLMNIRDFPYNKPEYNIVDPSISEDGTTLYFASDMPGGFGGFDIYRSYLIRGVWSTPENLGPDINTGNSERYPFIYHANRLYFSSNGHRSMGGLDIFFTLEKDSTWTKPAPLDVPVNSTSDDFSFVADSGLATGYFSTNRLGNDDIFSFTNLMPSLLGCTEQIENKYCFRFKDRKVEVDSIPNLIYNWDFGDGTTETGIRVRHCFSDSGVYNVKLTITDILGPGVFYSEETLTVKATPREQVYINVVDVDSTGIAGEPIHFDGFSSYLPEITPSEYHWFVDENSVSNEPEMDYVFDKPGSYHLKLVIKGIGKKENEMKEYCSSVSLVIVEQMEEN